MKSPRPKMKTFTIVSAVRLGPFQSCPRYMRKYEILSYKKPNRSSASGRVDGERRCERQRGMCGSGVGEEDFGR